MKKYLWIAVEEIVCRNIGLEIGVDITEEKARQLLAIGEKDNEYDTDTEEYMELDGYLGQEISDTGGFTEVQIFERD